MLIVHIVRGMMLKIEEEEVRVGRILVGINMNKKLISKIKKLSKTVYDGNNEIKVSKRIINKTVNLVKEIDFDVRDIFVIPTLDNYIRLEWWEESKYLEVTVKEEIFECEYGNFKTQEYNKENAEGSKKIEELIKWVLKKD